MGKIHYFLVIFNSYVTNYQRVNPERSPEKNARHREIIGDTWSPQGWILNDIEWYWLFPSCPRFCWLKGPFAGQHFFLNHQTWSNMCNLACLESSIFPSSRFLKEYFPICSWMIHIFPMFTSCSQQKTLKSLPILNWVVPFLQYKLV